MNKFWSNDLYGRNKKRACAYIGVESRAYELPEDTTEEQLVELVKELNADDTVNGILVQLPLPAQIDEDKIIRTISADKDVDGFHPESVGRLWIGEKGYQWQHCFSGKMEQLRLHTPERRVLQM